MHRIEMPVTLDATSWDELDFRAMGSTARLVVGDAPAGLVAWAAAEVEQLEQRWSRFRATSELCAINAAAGTWRTVSGPTMQALLHARELHRITSGAFDPTILTALERCGYDRSFELIDRASSDAAPSGDPAPGFDAVELDEDTRSVRVPTGARVDLGGIGKGLAADMITQGLVDRGARHAILSLGGDVRAAGEPPDGGWRVPVEDPRDEGRTLFEHTLTRAAIVTSTRAFRSWTRGGERFHHIIDPRTGRPTRVDGTVAVIVAAEYAWRAEGLAKAALVLGREAGAELLRVQGVEAWIVEPEGVVAVERAERAA